MDGQSEKHTAHAHVSSSRATSLRNNACCGTIMKIMDGTKIRNFRMERRRKKKRKESFQLSNLSDLLLPGLLIIFVPTTFTVFAQIADKNKALISLIAISTDRSHRIYIYIILIFPCWNVRVYI